MGFIRYYPRARHQADCGSKTRFITSFQGNVSVRKNDLLGFTLQLAQPATLTVALQNSNNGEWIRLVERERFTTGRIRISTESSQKVTDDQTRGRLVVGPPDDVEAIIRGETPSKAVVELSIVPEVIQ